MTSRRSIDRLTGVAIASAAGTVAFAGAAGAMMVTTRQDIPRARAMYDAGLAAGIAAAVLAVGTGATICNRELLRRAMLGHERLYELLDDRLEGIEGFERRQAAVTAATLDQVAIQRAKREARPKTTL